MTNFSTSNQIIETEEDWKDFWGNLQEDYEAINLLGLLEDWVDPLRELHQGYFDSETSPDGDAWPELAASTIARKGHDTILVDKGALAASLTEGTGDSILVIYDEGRNKGIVFGTDVEHSQYQNPEREHVGLSEAVLDVMAEQVADETLERWADG